MGMSAASVATAGPPQVGARRAGDAADLGTARLLWAAANPYVEPAVISELADQVSDWQLAVQSALHHRIGPLLWNALGSLPERPADATDQLRADAAAWFARTHSLAEAVAHAIQPLTARGLEPVLFKGPAVARRYPSLSLRPMTDIDMVLPTRQHAAALDALQRTGWRVVGRRSRLHHETVLAHPEVPVYSLELHRAFDTWHERATALNSRDVWRRRRPFDCLGTPAFEFEPADELIVLAVHAAKPFHSFGRLIWIADLVVALENDSRHHVIDWDLVAERAHASGAETILAVALSMAGRAGAAPPAKLPALPRQKWRLAVLAPLLDERWPLRRPRESDRHRVSLALADSPRRRVQLLLGETKWDPMRARPGIFLRRVWQGAQSFIRMIRQMRATNVSA